MKIFQPYIALLALLLLPCAANAQTELPAKVEVTRPAELQTDKLTLSAAEKVAAMKSGDFDSRSGFWDVLSDRDCNITRQSPDESAEPFDTLSLNESVRIATIRNGWALVYQDEPRTMFPAISVTDARSRGWIPLSNLLLWTTSPLDDASMAYRKVVFAADLEKNSTPAPARMLRNPRDIKSKGNASMLDYYFIMKTEGNKYLLSRAFRREGNTPVLCGWAYFNEVTPWDNRLVIEPTLNRRVVYNQLNGKDIVAYTDPAMTHEAARYTFDYNQMSREPSVRRLPVFEIDSTRVKALFFGNNSAVTLNEKYRNKLHNQHKAYCDSAHTANIILVMDGTEDIAPYASEVKNALIKGARSLERSGYAVKVGAVIYRDSTNVESVIETFPVTSLDNPLLGNFLGSVGEFGIQELPKPTKKTYTKKGSRYAKSKPERHDRELYTALETALNTRRMGCGNANSNIIVLVGSNSNIPTPIPEPDPFSLPVDTVPVTRESLLADAFADSGISLIAIQTRNNAEVPESMGYQTLIDSIAPRTPLGINLFREAETLDSLEVAAAITSGLAQFAELIKSHEKSLALEPNADTAWARRVMGDTMVDDLLNHCDYSAAVLYAPVKAEDGLTDLWQPCIFLTSEEFNRMIPLVKELSSYIRKIDPERESMVNTLSEIVRQFAPDVDPLTVRLDDIKYVIAGIDPSRLNRKLYREDSYTLAQLKNPSTIDDIKLTGIASVLNTKCQRLMERQRSQAVYKVDGSTIYLIPLFELF